MIFAGQAPTKRNLAGVFQIICLWKFLQAVYMQDVPCKVTDGQTDDSAVEEHA